MAEATDEGIELRSSVPLQMSRAGWFTAAIVIIALIGDGWSGRPGPLAHQLLLLPFTAAFLTCTFQLLFGKAAAPAFLAWTVRRAILVCICFEALAGLLFFYEAHHFARLGYRAHRAETVLLVLIGCAFLFLCLKNLARPLWVAGVVLATYTAGIAFSIWNFPLTYLRSDMLPIIGVADHQILHGGSPYAMLHLGTRLYSFPYLPGMLVAYLPFAALKWDLRIGSLLYLIGTALLILWAARRERRLEVSALLGIFLLSPFLQYRHELYIQPHWFTLVLAIVLIQHRRFAWAAFVFGISMAIYQFSWILFPFVLLNGYRRRGWAEAIKLSLLGVAGALALAGPFLHATANKIANNTVSQWGRMAHANADAMNLSYWVTYFIPTNRLLWLQAGLMVLIFACCLFGGRCRDLADTLRWMSVALTTFVLFNVIVDGYFYLMVSIVLLAYTCVANGWWAESRASETPHASTLIPVSSNG